MLVSTALGNMLPKSGNQGKMIGRGQEIGTVAAVFHNGRTAKKQCRQDACTALDWVTGLFFQSGRLLGLIMQAIATVIGADLGRLCR